MKFAAHVVLQKCSRRTEHARPDEAELSSGRDLNLPLTLRRGLCQILQRLYSSTELKHLGTAYTTSADDRNSSLHVVIVLATFNGARFLREQIESIQGQTHRNFTLYIRDDDSSDTSREIVRSFTTGDARIVLEIDQLHLGCSGSFGALLNRAILSGAEYVLLADQDDVWIRDKVEVQLRAMREAEELFGPNTPLLVHSDLTIVTSDLRVLHPSFMQFSRLSHIADQPLRTLLAQNFVTGCTILVNRSLLTIALPFPPNLAVHDWWLAMCAAATGRILYVPQSTVLYRQHQQNTIGLHRAGKGVLYWINHRKDLASITARGVVQVRRLLNRLEERGLHEQQTTVMVQRLCRALASDNSRITRLILLIASGAKRQGLWPYLSWLASMVVFSFPAGFETE